MIETNLCKDIFLPADLKDQLAEEDPELLFADGFDEALIGTVSLFTKDGIVETALYDLDKCRYILMMRDGMDCEGADEFLSFNVLQAYIGEKTPGFATIANRDNIGKVKEIK